MSEELRERWEMWLTVLDAHITVAERTDLGLSKANMENLRADIAALLSEGVGERERLFCRHCGKGENEHYGSRRMCLGRIGPVSHWSPLSHATNPASPAPTPEREADWERRCREHNEFGGDDDRCPYCTGELCAQHVGISNYCECDVVDRHPWRSDADRLAARQPEASPDTKGRKPPPPTDRTRPLPHRRLDGKPCDCNHCTTYRAEASPEEEHG